MKIFCVIPAYNEEKKIAQTIADVKNYIADIVVVDDGSADATADAAKQAGVKVLEHIINRGQGAALATGNEYAKDKGADIIVHYDADGQFVPAEIPVLLAPLLKNECDVSLGSRFIEGEPDMPWSKRHILFPLAHLVNYLLLGVSLSDPQSGFRALGKKGIEKIRIEQDGSAHCSEILYKAKKENLRIKEVPITVIYNEYGQTLFKGKGRRKGGLQIIKDLLIARIIQ